MSPTQKSKLLLEEQGYLVAIVEKWNPHARVRQDLFNIIDILAIKDGETVAVQTTSKSNMSAREKKIAEHENTPIIRKAGWKIILHGWAKNKAGRWEIKEKDLS